MEIKFIGVTCIALNKFSASTGLFAFPSASSAAV